MAVLAVLAILGGPAGAAGGAKAVAPTRAPTGAGGEPPAVVSREAYVMGTRARLVTLAGERAGGLADLERLLEAIEDAERQLSTWRPTSVMSELNRVSVPGWFPVGARLCAMFDRIVELQRETGGAFDPAIGTLIEAWGLRDGGRVPSAQALAVARASSGLDHFTWDAEACAVERTADAIIDAGGFGKGEALDRARAAAGSSVGPWMIDLGGQVAVGGPRPPGGGWEVGVAHPARRDESVLTLVLAHGSVAVSGGSERDLVVDGQRVGHVLDPRTGRPAAFTGTVVVWDAEALVADVLSTALYVMGPTGGMAWSDDRGVAAAFLEAEPPAGPVRIRMTRAFKRRFGL